MYFRTIFCISIANLLSRGNTAGVIPFNSGFLQPVSGFFMQSAKADNRTLTDVPRQAAAAIQILPAKKKPGAYTPGLFTHSRTD